MKWWIYIIIFLVGQLAGGIAGGVLSNILHVEPTFAIAVALALANVLSISRSMVSNPVP